MDSIVQVTNQNLMHFYLMIRGFYCLMNDKKASKYRKNEEMKNIYRLSRIWWSSTKKLLKQLNDGRGTCTYILTLALHKNLWNHEEKGEGRTGKEKQERKKSLDSHYAFMS